MHTTLAIINNILLYAVLSARARRFFSFFFFVHNGDYNIITSDNGHTCAFLRSYNNIIPSFASVENKCYLKVLVLWRTSFFLILNFKLNLQSVPGGTPMSKCNTGIHIYKVIKNQKKKLILQLLERIT